MENSDGFLKVEKIQRTKILPLRWIGNYIFHPLSMFFFNIAIRENEDNVDKDLLTPSPKRALLAWKLYNWLDYPYEWWGTYYELDLKHLKIDAVLDKLGSDYDEDGIPYWEKE
jgi:hypothetical protein